MSSAHSSIRAFGQRSIASFFLSRPSDSSGDSKEAIQSKASKKGSGASLADFLDRKLQTSSVLPGRVEDKSRPFSLPLGPTESSGNIEGHSEAKKGGEAKPKGVIDKAFFEQFKHDSEVKGNCEDSFSVAGEVEDHFVDEVQESRKRRNPFQVGEDKKQIARKGLLVLGGDPKPKQKRRQERFICKKKPRPLYNHYANGSGWWDCNMEGVDNEEVGFNDVWEGVGSTTLGGIEWH